MEFIKGLDNWLTSAPEPNENWCDRCDAVIDTDDMFEPACSCDPDAHCSDCGEELPEEFDAHCENCCECSECFEADESQ